MTTYVPPVNTRRSSSQSKGGTPMSPSMQTPPSPSRDSLYMKGTQGSRRSSSVLSGGQQGSASTPSSPVHRSLEGPPMKLVQIFGVCSHQGRRPYQEDRAVVHAADAELTAYGVFDGHGGDAVSTLLVGGMDFMGRVLGAVKAAHAANRNVGDAVAQVYNTAHKELLARKGLSDTCGSCAVTAVVQRRPDGAYCLHVSNCGDSRCLVFNSATRACTRLSVDHKPDLPGERARIGARGGAVLSGRLFCNRGATAVSRALGDRVFAAHGLVPDPHVHSARIGQSDAFMILFSDGLTEQMTDEEVCEVVAGHLSRGATPEQAAKAVVQYAIDHPGGQFRQSNDNVTAVVVQFMWSPA